MVLASCKIQYLRTCHLSIIALGLVSRGTSLWICFGSPFTSKGVVCGQSCDFVPHNYETLKWLSLLPILIQESFWWRQCCDMYIISLFPYHHTPPPLPITNKPYVSVDVKHHVYLLTIAPTPTAVPHICQKQDKYKPWHQFCLSSDTFNLLVLSSNKDFLGEGSFSL